jgi:hypothetical protein
MKRVFIVSLVIALASCNLSKTNINPNASSEVSISAVLSGAEVSLGFHTGINGGLIANIYIQQASGANGDAASFDNYTTSPGYFNSTWGGFYTNVLDELRIIRETATEQELPYYRGIARVLTAFSFGTLTDMFGDIPFNEALYKNDITNPVYDSQETIYKALQAQLDSAIIDLSKPPSANKGALPAGDDVIFKGHIPSWLATAWTLKARYAIHGSKQHATDAAQKVLDYLYDGNNWRGITSANADAQVVFGAATTNANPFYQQNTNRPGWVGLGASFVNLLNGNKVTDAPTKPEGPYVDPRRAYFATPYGNTYQGSAPGVPGAFSRIGSYYNTATSPVILVSFSEAKFLEAEARSLLNDPKAQTALEAAVRASFYKVIDNPNDPYATAQKQNDYIANKATLDGANDLETIITQKYIALFLQPEVWTDYRRTGYPAIPLAQNATHSANPNGQIPRRIPYPQNESSLNKNTPANSGYQQPKLWWDR